MGEVLKPDERGICEFDQLCGPNDRCYGHAKPDRSHGQGKTGRVSKQNDSAVDLKQALNTIRLALEKLGDEPTQIAWAQFKRLHMELRADLGLVERTVEGVQRRMR
jgi:hypothetical protein